MLCYLRPQLPISHPSILEGNGLLWVNPGQQLSSTQQLLDPLQRDGRENGKGKNEKIHGLRLKHLIDKAKAAHANKATQGIHSLLISHLQESRAPVTPNSYMGRQSTITPYTHAAPAPILLPSALQGGHDVTWYAMRGQLSWLCSLPTPCAASA